MSTICRPSTFSQLQSSSSVSTAHTSTFVAERISTILTFISEAVIRRRSYYLLSALFHNENQSIKISGQETGDISGEHRKLSNLQIYNFCFSQLELNDYTNGGSRHGENMISAYNSLAGKVLLKISLEKKVVQNITAH
jgi:hypothetical protein